LLTADLSDSLVQNSGLIKVSGSCQIAGIVVPTPGSKVFFYYVKDGITRRIPRAVRVLSSFADPYRNVTTVELGCKLTYLQEYSEPINWDAYDDTENDGREGDELIVTVPIRASSAMNYCLQKLGITANLNPLTNQFSISEFSYDSGYVNVLNDLLLSESYCGYLDIDEILNVFPLFEAPDSGPIIRNSDLIDVGRIGTGEIAADTVVVTYSTYKLKAPDDEELTEGEEEGDLKITPWGADTQTTESSSEIIIQYTDFFEEPLSKKYNILEKSQTTTNYELIEIQSEDGETERRNVVRSRITTSSKTNAGVITGIFQQYLDIGLEPGLQDLVTITTETFTYDSKGNQISSTSITRGHPLYEVGTFGIDFVYDFVDVIDLSIFDEYDLIDMEKTVTSSSVAGSYRSTTTEQYTTWPKTLEGQQSIAVTRESIEDVETATSFINEVINTISKSGFSRVNLSISTERTGYRGEEAPLPAEITNANNADPDADPNNGYRVDSRAEIVLVTGERDANLVTEFSMPYAPDDIFYKTGSGFRSSRSDAPAKAMRFGTVQNKMLLGNRYGLSLQVAPEKISSKPYSPILLEASGTIVMYRANGLSWAMDSSGVIVSCDALYWGVMGRTL